MRNTKRIGDITEVRILTKLVEEGWCVSIPWGENAKYDLIGEKDEKFYRIQCKTGRIRNGAVVFNGYTSHAHRGGVSEGYRGKADLFGVYCPGNGAVYLVPVTKVPEGKVHLRLDPARNNQEEGVRYAKEYEV